MDTTTRDFMNVDSFSQLPFMRPPPPLKEKPIRLFGQEFGGAAAHPRDSESPVTDGGALGQNEYNDENGGIIMSRRFECQYCCRNFPTSQALGGHQNAHKLERQRAKRADFHAAMIIGGGLPPEAGSNYRLHYSAPAPATPFFPAATRVFGGFIAGHGGAACPYYQTPINGSPLPLWRLMHPPPALLASQPPAVMMMSSSNAARQIGRYGFEPKPNVKDHNVSLDLHL